VALIRAIALCLFNPLSLWESARVREIKKDFFLEKHPPGHEEHGLV
jgi:hypothetical protein